MKPYTGTVVRGDPPPIEFTDEEQQQAISQNADPRNKAELAREIGNTKSPKNRAILQQELNNLPTSASTLKPYHGEVMPADAAPAAPTYDVGNSFAADVGNFAQGVRKGVVDVGMGINQRFAEGARFLESQFGGQDLNRALGWPTAQEIADKTNKTIEDRKTYYDPLMKTNAGLTGNVTGQMGAAIPLTFVPGAATIRGGAAIGGLQGFLSPTTGKDDVLENTATGAALGGILPAAYGAYRLGKSALAPFRTSEINDRAMKTLGAYGIKPEDLRNVDSITTITGAKPSMAEQITNPEAAASAARLQDNLSTLPAQQRDFVVRNMENNEARLRTLQDVAGVGGAKTAAENARSVGAAKDYGEAFKVPFDIQKFPQTYKTAYNDLMAKPAIQDAMRIAQKEAANQGLNFDPTADVQSLQLVKRSMDGLVTKAEAAGQETLGLTKTTAELVDFMKNISKRYETARSNFAERSIPINQMQVAEKLIKQGTSPTPDLYGNPQLRVGGLLQAMRDEPSLIKRSTGGLYGGDGTLSGLLNPEQFAKVQAVANETGKHSAVLTAGIGSGSPTVQRSMGVDLLMGGGGLMTGGVGGGLLGAAKGAVNYVKDKVIEPKLQATLREMVLNPGKAQEIMKSLAPKDRTIIQDAINNRFLTQSLRTSLPALYNSENN